MDNFNYAYEFGVLRREHGYDIKFTVETCEVGSGPIEELGGATVTATLSYGFSQNTYTGTTDRDGIVEFTFDVDPQEGYELSVVITPYGGTPDDEHLFSYGPPDGDGNEWHVDGAGSPGFGNVDCIDHPLSGANHFAIYYIVE